MSSFQLLRRFAAFACLLSAAACAKGDASPVKQAGTPALATSATKNPSAAPTDSISGKADAGRIRGAESAPIWFIEISDFQCPFCKRWHDETFATIDKEYVQTGKVRIAYLNLPLITLHPNARIAAEAAMCSSVQGKFWEMHEALFATQLEWAKLPNAEAYLQDLAAKNGVNVDTWHRCMSDHATIPLIDADASRSNSAGAHSTPTFLIGPEGRIEGAFPADSFRVVIDKALAKARGGK